MQKRLEHLEGLLYDLDEFTIGKGALDRRHSVIVALLSSLITLEIELIALIFLDSEKFEANAAVLNSFCHGLRCRSKLAKDFVDILCKTPDVYRNKK